VAIASAAGSQSAKIQRLVVKFCNIISHHYAFQGRMGNESGNFTDAIGANQIYLLRAIKLTAESQQPKARSPLSMSQSFSPAYTERLRSLMQAAGISSFRALRQRAEVSKWAIQQLRKGQAERLRTEQLYRLGQALTVPIDELLRQFSGLQPKPVQNDNAASLETLQQEYHRLQEQLQQQREQLWQEFQQTSLEALESWLIQFPTAAHAAQTNPQVPASRLLPLMRPLEKLLQTWQVEAIAPVGAEVPYDPQMHQLMEGDAQPGEPVRVRYTGYRQGDRLLYRARVSPV
jgi:molecular chaperone GrpE (heat shock protein)